MPRPSSPMKILTGEHIIELTSILFWKKLGEVHMAPSILPQTSLVTNM